MVIKFLEQFVLVARALERQGLYDADDAFFYDRLVYPSGESTQVKVKTISGLLPVLPAVPLLDPGRPGRRSGSGSGFPDSATPGRRPVERSGCGRVRRRAATTRRCSLSVIDPDELAKTPRGVLRRGRVPLAARASRRLEALRREPVHPRRRARRLDRLRAGRVDHLDVRRQLELARARSGCRSTTSRSASSSSTSTSSATSSSSNTRPARASSAPSARSPRTSPTGSSRSGSRARRPPAALRRNRASPDRPGLEGQPRLQRVLPRRQRRRPGRNSSDRLDGARRGSDPRPTDRRTEPQRLTTNASERGAGSRE